MNRAHATNEYMNLIAPQNLLFASLIGVIVLLYMLRLRRKERIVASTLLWQPALRDVQANAPWQKLRSSLLMWLQIAFLLLAVFALVRPAIKVLAAGGQTIAIVIDASASMGATDVSPSRFEKARSEAAQLIRNLSSGDQATIIAASKRTHVLAPLTADKNVLQRALANAQTEDTNCNLREAITLATSLLRDKKPAQIYVLSDGAVPALDDVSTGDIGLQFVKVGSGNNNLAITAMDVRRGYAKGSRYEIFATVRNFSDREKTIDLELTHNGELSLVRPMTIPARGQQSQLFNEGNFQSGLFSVSFDTKDDLATDNVAYATLEPAQSKRVLLISDGNTFLEKALNLDPETQVFRTTAADYTQSPSKGNFDVVVCDGAIPQNLVASNMLIFNAFSDAAPVEKANGVFPTPSVTDWDRRHPVTRFASWSDIRLAETANARLKPWGQALVETERAPLIVAGERNGRRVVWCGFDLRATDLPLRVTFPIFVTNAIRWLNAPSGSVDSQTAAPRAGDTVPLNVPPNTREVTLTTPDQKTTRIPIERTPLLLDKTTQIGLYSVTAGDWKTRFGVSLLNATESDLKPRDALKIRDGEISGATRARSNRELWGFIALAALALLGIEWWVFHRGI
jgi:Ca-activated chloride channel family protein